MSDGYEFVSQLVEDVKAGGGSQVILDFYDRYAKDRMSVPDHWRLFFDNSGANWDRDTLLNCFCPIATHVMKPKDDEAFRLYLDGE